MKTAAPPQERTAERRAIPWDWIAAGFAALVLAWMVTAGDWDLFAASGHLDGFFDAQAVSLLHGRMDVPPESLLYEAFTRNGKVYGYFGLTPALLRIPLVLVFPDLKGHWSRLSMLTASMLTLAALLLLLNLAERQLPELKERRLWRILRPGLLLALALGSTNLFIVAESQVYQEAILWAAALALTHYVCLGWYLSTGSTRWLAGACAAGLLAFTARVASGAGTMVSAALLDAALILPWPRFREYWIPAPLPRPKRAIAILTATVLAGAISWSTVNYLRFGMWLTTQPVQFNFTPERLARMKGSPVAVANVPYTLYCYFSPRFIHVWRQFPWIWGYTIPRDEMAARFPAAHIDESAPLAAIPVTVPQLLAAALAGTALVLRKKREHLKGLRIAICGAAAGCGSTFLYSYVAERYIHDLFPWFAIGTVAAAAWIATREGIQWRKAALAAFAALSVYSGWAHFAMGLEYQRLFAMPSNMEPFMRMTDASMSTLEGGLGGLVSFYTHRRIYIAPESFESGNVRLDRTMIPKRPEQPVVRSAGAPPYRVRWVVNIPEDGEYELAIRYASAEPRPALLAIDGRPVGHVFTQPTGGTTSDDLKWGLAGRHRLRRGLVGIELASEHEFPPIHALRLVEVR